MAESRWLPPADVQAQLHAVGRRERVLNIAAARWIDHRYIDGGRGGAVVPVLAVALAVRL